MRLDPVTLEIFGNKVLAACEEMNPTLQRSSRSLFVKEAADYACALLDLDGRIMANPKDTCVSLFVDLDAMPTIRLFDDLGPGDVILLAVIIGQGDLGLLGHHLAACTKRKGHGPAWPLCWERSFLESFAFYLVS